jgi:putative membrane protein
MKWFGIGTAVMALAVAAGEPSYGQDKTPGSQGQPSPGSQGQSSPGSQGQASPGTRGQSGDRSTSQRPAETGQASRADAQGFLNEMSIANLAEVQLGKMANEKASNADVKAFGQMMVKDHTQANDELKQIASQLKIQQPAQLDQKHKDLSDKLSKLQGAEFDREYVNAMVQGHQEVLGKLRARADSALPGSHGAGAADHSGASASSPEKGLPSTTTNSNKPVAQDSATATAQSGKGATTGRGQGDEALTQWAAKTMPKVQMHLERAKELQSKVAK